MLKAFRVEYTFPVAVELSDDDRNEIVKQALTMAEAMDRGDDETFVFGFDCNGKEWKIYVDIGRRRVHLMTKEEAAEQGLPGGA